MRNFVNLTTASAIALTSVMATVAPAAAAPLKSWEDTIAEAKAHEKRTGRKGISSSLTAVQVTNLVEYTAGGVDFDIVEDAEPVASEDLF